MLVLMCYGNRKNSFWDMAVGCLLLGGGATAVPRMTAPCIDADTQCTYMEVHINRFEQTDSAPRGLLRTRSKISPGFR